MSFLRSSLRIAHREVTAEDPPAGPHVLVQLVLLYAFGSSQHGSDNIAGFENARIESGAAGYAGLIVALVFTLGWRTRAGGGSWASGRWSSCWR